MKRIQVLMVEDNPGDVELVRELLQHSIEIEALGRLDAAEKRLRRGGVDVVLLDLNLPDSRGGGTFERVRKVAPSVPVIVVTGVEPGALPSVEAQAFRIFSKDEMDGPTLARAIRTAAGGQGLPGASQAPSTS